jgi:CBS domain-containing protein
MQNKLDSLRGDASGGVPQLQWLGPLFAGITEWNRGLCAVCADANREYLDFLRRRGVEDVGFPARLASCKTPTEVMQVYQSFFEKAARDYQDEYAALARIGSSALSDETDESDDADEQGQALRQRARPIDRAGRALAPAWLTGDVGSNPIEAGRREREGVSDMKVKDAMHKGVEWVEPDTPISEIAAKMKELDVGAIPVGENDRLVGMVTDRDITCRGLSNSKDPANLTARDVMTKGIIYCKDDEDLADAVRIMEQRKVRRLPVLNDKKRMVGILSLGDVSHAGSRTLAGEVVTAVSAHH